MNRSLWLLTLCQGLFLTNNVVLIAINGLVGLALAPLPWMATLPITAYVAGGALATGLVARHQRAWGRRRGFQVGLLTAIFAAGLGAVAVLLSSFALLLVATLIAGYYNANGSLYRFAAVELVPAERKERAISWVLAGSLMGAFLGPFLAQTSRDWLAQPFAGAYVALVVVALLALLIVSQIDFPPLPTVDDVDGPARPTAHIARQPMFIVAVAACALGYGVMNLLMAATPLAMAQHDHPFGHAALVLQWHVVGMYLPSFFTGNLIQRWGVMPVLVIGLILNLVCVAVALSGVDLMHFGVALFVLGVGWNFLFIGGTALATQCYRPSERTSAQARVDLWVYSTMTLTSFGSGALVTTGGWTFMNLGTLLPLTALALALFWAWRVRRRN